MPSHSQNNYYLRLQVLHIEDDAGIVNTVRRLFTLVPYAHVDIFNAFTLQDGLLALREDKWDCVLLDLALPDSTGITTFHHVRGITDVPIVVLTAEDDLERRARVVAAGAQDCVYKMEMTPDLLIRSVRFAVERNLVVQQLRSALKEVQAAHRALQELVGWLDGPED
jgi:DNA-binding response OmpR family regulator